MTNDKQRERLVNLIEDAVGEGWRPMCEAIADNLLIEGGIIVPPCKVGQTVYTRHGYSFKIQRIEVLEDKKILFRCGNDGTDDYMAFYDFEIGTDVFLAKEGAEAKLKEGV